MNTDRIVQSFKRHTPFIYPVAFHPGIEVIASQSETVSSIELTDETALLCDEKLTNISSTL